MPRPKKWFPGEFVHCCHPIPKTLDEQLNLLLRTVNNGSPTPIDKGDLVRAALAEYVKRREHLFTPEA